MVFPLALIVTGGTTFRSSGGPIEQLPTVQQLMVVETPAEFRADTQRPDPNPGGALSRPTGG